MTNRKIKPCKWYYACPIKKYTEKGKLERCGIENYCLVNNNTCIRYQMQEKGKYHPDNMLPNGVLCPMSPHLVNPNLLRTSLTSIVRPSSLSFSPASMA